MKRVELKTEIIKMLLSKKKATMLELSKYLNIRAPLMSKYINGDTKCPMDIAEDISTFFGVELETILKNSDSKDCEIEMKSNDFTHHLLQIWKTFDTKDKLRFLFKAIKFSEKIKEMNKTKC